MATQEQIDIIFYDPYKNMLINACPGSGKTTTIIMKILAMTRDFGISLKEIALFTFNKYLSIDMVKKLEAYGINQKSLGWCGTLHAFCYQWTKNKSDLTKWVSLYKDSNNPVPNIKWVIFDEFQDADEEIYDVLELLVQEKFLILCGDERQQIYSHRGADADLLPSLKEDFVKKSLSQSFRCNQNICQLLTALYPSYPKINSNITGPKPFFYSSSSKAMNHVPIIDEIIKIIKERKDDSIAIISPLVHTQAASKYMNDIHSNIVAKLGLEFICQLGEFRDNMNINPNIPNIISSIHGVKGREYDTVILLNAVDDPFLFDAPTPDALSKLFVAASRARQNLYIFEHIYHFKIGSLNWLRDNINLMTQTKNWVCKNSFRKDKESTDFTRNVVDWIRSINSEERNKLSAGWSSDKIVAQDIGLKNHYGHPELIGILVEWLLLMKILKRKICLDWQVYITAAEWKIIQTGQLPSTLKHKIKEVIGEVPRAIQPNENNKGKIETLSIFWSGGSMILNEKSIVSNLIEKEYYKYLPQAKKFLAEININLTKDTIKKLWWLTRFHRLTQLSLVGFNIKDLEEPEIKAIKNYIKGAKALDNLNINDYHVFVDGEINNVALAGEIDFSSPDTLIEIKCISGSLDEAWLQIIAYNKLYRNYKQLYIYNAFTGELVSKNKELEVSLTKFKPLPKN